MSPSEELGQLLSTAQQTLFSSLWTIYVCLLSLLGLLNPWLQTLFGSLWTLGDCLLSLPNFSLATVEGSLDMLALNWMGESSTVTKEQVDPPTHLNIQP